MTAKQIKWFYVMAAYLLDEKMSVRDVATKFGMSYFTTRNKAQRNHWFRDRVILHHRARQKMRRMMAYEEAKAEVIQKTLSTLR